MTQKMVYLASPFFTDEQKKVMDSLKECLDDLGYKTWAPYYECLVTPESTREYRRYAFECNMIALSECFFVVANIEGLDTGTVFEMGVAYSLKKPILAFSDNLDRKLNLMLAMSCIGFVNGLYELRGKLQWIGWFIDNPQEWFGEVE